MDPSGNRPDSPLLWPDPKRPGNRLRSIYLLGGFEIDDGNIELRSPGNTNTQDISGSETFVPR